MGRVFEKRKHKMFARYDKMAKSFTRIGKEIAMAVKANGPLPENNPRLRTAMQNAKGINMPKDRIDAAIKRASDKDESNYEEMVYEGYGPHGIALIIETATDNTTRTVANIRMYLSRNGGTLGKSGSLDFMFTRKGVFKIKAEGIDPDELELDLIDFGLSDLAVSEEEGLIYIYSEFAEFGNMQKALEDKKIEVVTAELQRIPNTTTDLTEAQAEEVLTLVAKLEEDDDVQQVFHNMKE